MTNLYFVRHSKIQYTHDDYSRQLSDEGRMSVPLVTAAFKNIEIDAIVSSPYVRVVETIKDIAEMKRLDIEFYDDLRERKVANVFIDDFHTFTLNQWNDFSFKLEGGESIAEVQARGSQVLEQILCKYDGKNVILGTHGTFMSVILNYYDSAIDFSFWRKLQMPDIYKVQFVKGPQGFSIQEMERISLSV